MARRRRTAMVARFDVSDLNATERDYLAGEVSAQAERSDGHPSIDSPSIGFSETPASPESGDATSELLDHVTSLVGYWASEGQSNVPAETSKREALEGLAFSMLVMLDGGALSAGVYELIPVDDEGRLGENIAGILHELWTSKGRR